MVIFKSPYPDVKIPEQTINELINSWISKNLSNRSEQVALISLETGRSVTYEQFEQDVDRLAVGLYKKGLRQKEVAAILLPNCIEYPISFLAVLKIGAIVTTATHTNTAVELIQQFNEAKVKYLITDKDHSEIASEVKKQCKTIEDIFIIEESSYKDLLQNDGKGLPEVKIDVKNDPAVIPFSSGTSGLPKGVVLTHYNIISNIVQLHEMETTNYGKDAVLLGILPFSHIYGMTVCLLVGLATGSKIVTMAKFDFVKFLDAIQKYKITLLHIVPPMVLALAKHPIVEKYDFSSLKSIISGAAPMHADLEIAASKRINVKIRQGFGMTEMSPVSHLTPKDKIVPGSVGVLLPNCLAKIIGPDGKEIDAEDGEGELCVKGPNVMKEYLNNPEATAETLDKDGYLRTGDVCKASKDGYFFITDRVKELIKYKGFQVPPAELEGILLTHPAVADAAVVGVPDEEAGELPKAYVVLKPGQSATPDEIKKYVGKMVAPYKSLRGGVEFIDVIPKSTSGKLLRRKLKEKK